MKTINLTIDGMSCNHCIMSVKQALEKVAGLTIHSVSVGSASVTFNEENTAELQITNAINNAGYTVTGSR